MYLIKFCVNLAGDSKELDQFSVKQEYCLKNNQCYARCLHLKVDMNSLHTFSCVYADIICMVFIKRKMRPRMCFFRKFFAVLSYSVECFEMQIVFFRDFPHEVPDVKASDRSLNLNV